MYIIGANHEKSEAGSSKADFINQVKNCSKRIKSDQLLVKNFKRIK